MTPEQLNALQVEQQIATDNYTNMNNRINAIRNLAQDYLKATPEQQAKAKGAMQQLMNEYSTLNGQINEAFGRMNAANENYNNAYATFNTPATQPTVRRRTIQNPTNTNNQGTDEAENNLLRLKYYTDTLGATPGTGGVLYNSKGGMYTSNGYAVDGKTGEFVNIPTNINNNNNTYSINRNFNHTPIQNMKEGKANTPVYTPSPYVKKVNDMFNRKFHLHGY